MRTTEGVTQKQAIINIMRHDLRSRAMRVLFLTRWLEDINWHGESHLVYGIATEAQREEIKGMLEQFERNDLDTLPKHELVNVAYMVHMLPYDIKKQKQALESFHTLNTIYGYGLDGSFEHDRGEDMANELMEMIYESERKTE